MLKLKERGNWVVIVYLIDLGGYKMYNIKLK